MEADLLGILQAPSGEKIKVVVASPGAIPDERVVAFPTLTKNIIVAINRNVLLDAVHRVQNESDEYDEDDVDEAMMEFVPEIVLAATRIMAATPNSNPFDFDGDA